MALYKVKQGVVKTVYPKEFPDEAALQELVDNNLEDITGVRLIDSQYAIPNGRIDSLGIDERNVPVVVEYKKKKDPNAIIQGLSYLRWVKDNRRIFELLVKEKFGKTNINWSSAPRLMVIAKAFDPRELSAIDFFAVSVELKKYSYYGDLLSVEDVVMTQKVKPSKEKCGQDGETNGVKTVEGLLKKASPGLKEAFYDLRDQIMALGDDAVEKVFGWYCDYRKSSTFVSVNVKPKKNCLLIYIKMGAKKIEDPNGWASPIPKTYNYGQLNTKFEISKSQQVPYAIQLIKQAYEYVP